MDTVYLHVCNYSVTEETNGSLKLTVVDACKEDEGAYKVKAENSEGVASSTGYLSVTGEQLTLTFDL